MERTTIGTGGCWTPEVKTVHEVPHLYSRMLGFSPTAPHPSKASDSDTSFNPHFSHSSDANCESSSAIL